jgi:hypothetical protein
MTSTQTTYVVVAGCGAAVLIAFVALVLVPAWTSYSRVWERLAATFMSLYVLLAFVGIGVAGGLGVAWFWDRIQG